MSHCPRCGCNGSHEIGFSQWWGDRVVRLECDHCRKTWMESAGETEITAYHILLCPKCNSKETKIASTRTDGVRHHKCEECTHSFKSIEVCH